MIYLDLLLGFLKVGCFAFGGAYAAIPLIRETVLSYGWLSDEMISYMIAVSESTPGPIMVNLATYVGSSQAGLPGAILATAAVVLPAFVILLLIVTLLKSWMKNRCVQAVLDGVKPAIIGVILATGLFMTFRSIVPETAGFDLRDLILAAVLALVMFGAEPLVHKKVSPIALIVLSALLGMAAFGG